MIQKQINRIAQDAKTKELLLVVTTKGANMEMFIGSVSDANSIVVAMLNRDKRIMFCRTYCNRIEDEMQSLRKKVEMLQTHYIDKALNNFQKEVHFLMSYEHVFVSIMYKGEMIVEGAGE